MAVYGDGNHWTPFLQKNTGVNNTLGNYQSALAAALAAQRQASQQTQTQLFENYDRWRKQKEFWQRINNRANFGHD